MGKSAVNNPFREDLMSRNLAEACSVVIFGATGDLTHRKLVPALYNLAIDGELVCIEAKSPVSATTTVNSFRLSS